MSLDGCTQLCFNSWGYSSNRLPLRAASHLGDAQVREVRAQVHPFCVVEAVIEPEAAHYRLAPKFSNASMLDGDRSETCQVDLPRRISTRPAGISLLSPCKSGLADEQQDSTVEDTRHHALPAQDGRDYLSRKPASALAARDLGRQREQGGFAVGTQAGIGTALTGRVVSGDGRDG